MSKPEPSIDQWLKEAKADPKAAQCGMFLTHNGIVRITPKKQVREGVQGLGEVAKVQFSYDAEGVAAAEKEALTWPFENDFNEKPAESSFPSSVFISPTSSVSALMAASVGALKTAC